MKVDLAATMQRIATDNFVKSKLATMAQLKRRQRGIKRRFSKKR